MIGDNRLRLMDILSAVEDGIDYDSGLERLRFIIKESLENENLTDDAYGFINLAINEILATHIGFNKKSAHLSYAPLSGILAKYNITITALCDALGFSAGVRSNLVNNRPVNVTVLNKIAVLLNCEIDDMVEFISENEVRRRLHFGRLVKNSPKLIETAMDGQYAPSYLDEDATISTPEGVQHNIRSFALNFDDKRKGYDFLFGFLGLDEDDYRASQGLADEL